MITRCCSASPTSLTMASILPNLKRMPKPPQNRRPPQNRQPPTAAQAAQQVLNQPAQAAKTAQIAKMALTLRQLATAAAALRQLPGGGLAADGLLAILDKAVNSGGKFHVLAGKLQRTTPPKRNEALVGANWLLRVAPWAMGNIGTAVQAARVGLARFGADLPANLSTAASYVAGKIKGLVDKAVNLPAITGAAAIVRKAMNAAGHLLGIGGPAAAEPAQAAPAAASAAAAAPAGKAKVVWKGRPPAPTPPGQRPPTPLDLLRPPAADTASGGGLKWLALAGLALVFVPKLLK